MRQIYFFDEYDKIPEFDSEFFCLWIQKVEKHENVSLGNLNYIFYPNQEIRAINVQYLNHDFDTDVITFDYSDNGFISGDVFINIDFIRSFSSQNKIPFLKELSRIIIHGTLHLCGYDDKSEDEKKRMTQREDFYLSLQ